MPQSPVAFRVSLLKSLSRKAHAMTRPHIPSKTLKRALFWKIKALHSAYLEVPHYWAVYYHRGHERDIRPRRARFLVWFTNPKDDPRLKNGAGPERYRDVKRLTKEQWDEGLRRNAIRQAKGRPPFMIIALSRKASPGIPFYDNALGKGKFLIEAEKIIERRAKRFVKSALSGSGFKSGVMKKETVSMSL